MVQIKRVFPFANFLAQRNTVPVASETRMPHLTRSEQLPHGPMQYAPTNELGVVFLFAHLARRLRVRIESINVAFPDCIAYQKAGGREKRLRIEFEYRSSNFRTHGHSPRGCDWIVCWQHDWPGVPRRIHVVELSSFFGLGFNVWIQPVIPSQWHHLKSKRLGWGLSKRAHPGDLLLMYRCAPDKRIEDVFRLGSGLRPAKAGWRDGGCFDGDIVRVCSLSSPISLDDLRFHPVIRTSPFVRGNMQGNLLVTEYWPHLYQMITARNQKCRKVMRRFAPD